MKRSGPGRLARLDDRFASSGPLGLVREVPPLGLLVVAAVFAAGSGAALSMRDPVSGAARAQEQEQDGGLPLSLGPEVGSTVEDHLAAARALALTAAARDPRAEHLALVSLTDERSPGEAQQLVKEGSVSTRRVYLRAPVSGKGAELVPVDTSKSLVAELPRVFADTARRKTAEQREFVALAASIESTGPEEADFKAFYEAVARTAGEEAAGYQGPCACVLALVVEGTAAQLVELATRPGVRGVELAAEGAELDELLIDPVPPEVTGTVQAPDEVPDRP